MNLKERGITIGDLLILIIILGSVFFLIKIKDSKNDQSLKSNSIVVNRINKLQFDHKIL